MRVRVRQALSVVAIVTVAGSLAAAAIEAQAVAQAPAAPAQTLTVDQTLPIDPAVPDRAAGQRAPLLHPPQRPAGQSGVAAAGRQRRLGVRRRRSARARAFPRAHGVQRHRELQARRAHQLSRNHRRALWSARQRLHLVRRDGLHARCADRQARLRRSRPARAPRLRRRHVAPGRRDREGTRRRHRGVARPTRRRLALDRQAAAGAAREVALRRAAADRHARDSQVVPAAATGRLLSQVVPPRSNGRDRRRRRRSGRGAEAGRAAVRRYPSREDAARSGRPHRAAHKETLFAIATDPEAQGWSVALANKRPVEIEKTVGDYRRSLIQQLATQMLNLRLSEIARRPNAPFLGAEAGGSGLGRSVELYELGAAVQEGGIAAGLEALIVEARRMQQFGFSADELDRARAALLAGFERAFKERNTSESTSYAGEYVRAFLEQEPIPGIEFEYKIASTFVPTVTAGRSHRRSAQADPRRQPRRPRGGAGEERRAGADRGRAARRHGQGREGAGRGLHRRAGRARPRREAAGAGQGRGAADRWPRSARRC